MPCIDTVAEYRWGLRQLGSDLLATFL